MAVRPFHVGRPYQILDYSWIFTPWNLRHLDPSIFIARFTCVPLVQVVTSQVLVPLVQAQILLHQPVAVDAVMMWVSRWNVYYNIINFLEKIVSDTSRNWHRCFGQIEFSSSSWDRGSLQQYFDRPRKFGNEWLFILHWTLKFDPGQNQRPKMSELFLSSKLQLFCTPFYSPSKYLLPKTPFL